MKAGVDGAESIMVCHDHPGDIADLQDLLVFASPDAKQLWVRQNHFRSKERSLLGSP